jgi:cytochrome c oxidase subunit 4
MSDNHGHHIIPFRTLATVFGSLLVLTVITVAVAQIDLGPLDVPVAIGIATVKAALVALYFMALKYDKPVNALTFTVGTLFVVIFVTFTLFDTAFRGDLGNVSSKTIQELQAEEEELQRRQEAIPEEQLRVTPADYQGAESSDTSGGTSGDASGDAAEEDTAEEDTAEESAASGDGSETTP